MRLCADGEHSRSRSRAAGPSHAAAETAKGLRTMWCVYRAISDHPECDEIRLALETWAELAGPMEGIPAHAPSVRALLKRVDPTRNGIPHRRWAHCKKLIGTALRHLGLERMPARFEVPLTAEWRSLLMSAPDRPYRVAIQRFARWCSMRENGISPTHVQPADFDRFGEDLRETTRPDLARNVYLALCNTWMKAVDAFPHWPRVRPRHVLRRLWYTRSWEVYPRSLVSEIDRLFEARRTCEGDVLSPWRAPIGSDTEKTQRGHLRKYLHALCETGVAPDQLTTLAEVLKAQHVDSALGWMRLRNCGVSTLELYNVAVLLRSIARNWLRLEATALIEFQDIVKEIRKPVVGPKGAEISDKTKDLLLRLEDKALRTALRQLSRKILDRYASRATLKRAEALEVETALAIDLAIATVLSPTRLAALQLRLHIVCRPGKLAVLRLSEFRNGDIIEELPRVTTDLINVYTKIARSRLQRDCANNLFPGTAGRSKLPVVLTRQIARLVKRECGIRITASQFKWVVAVLQLKREPNNYEAVRDLLGYRTVEAVERVFGPRGRQDAFDRHDDRLSCRAGREETT